jgi:hypothetical protein
VAVTDRNPPVAVAAATQRDDLGAQQVHPRTLELIERSRLRRRQQLQGGVRRAGRVLGQRRGQRTLRPSRRVECQPGGAFVERGRGG